MESIATILQFPVPSQPSETQERLGEEGDQEQLSPEPIALTGVCPLCKGAGYRRVEVPYGHTNFGKPVECRCKVRQRSEHKRQLLFEMSHIHELAAFQEESFETFRFWLAGVRPAFDAAKAFATSPSGWLILCGGNGCGKTHLAVSIAKSCMANGKSVLFAVVPDLLDYLRATFDPSAEESYDAEFRKMKEVEVLLLDDLGSEAGTLWAMEKLFQLLNYRYNARLPTVVTTNLIGLLGVPLKLRSRLRDHRLATTLTLTGAQDYRELDLEGQDFL